MDATDLAFEEEVARNPYSLQGWLSYIAAKAATAQTRGPLERFVLYERSLRFLPRSYKLWHAYLLERVERLEHKCITHPAFAVTVDTFERSLIHMHKMPRIWLDYCALLVRMKRGTETRRVFDRALQSLPVTQHKDIWALYIAWVRNFGVEETAVRVYRRYLMFDPSQRESFVDYLEERGQYEEAARQLTLCVEDEHFVSPSGKSKHEIWMHLCNLCANHPEHVCRSLKVEEIIRGGISRFSDEVGRLWCRLADYYIRLGQFDQARDIYEEALDTVKTVRDFTIVFDAYVKVEESLLTAKMQIMQEEEDEVEEGGGLADSAATMEALNADVEMRLARLEFVMEKRPLQLNSVVLRQNPHNVHEWLKRIKLFKDEDKRKLGTMHDALNAVDPSLAVGRLSAIWMALAKYHERRNDLESARAVWRRAVEVNLKSVDELAALWCAWAEMEMHHENYEGALEIMERAVTEPPSTAKRRKALSAAQGKHRSSAGDVFGDDCAGDGASLTTTAERLHKNVKVWSLYLDLEESLGQVETCRAAYDRVFDLKVVTPQMALNYASFLEERDFFEDSFRIFEKAVSLFTFPHVKKVWLVYLEKFMARYEGAKLERLRDLFEQAVSKVPPEDAAEFFIKYAKAEEAYGLARHAMAIYDRATSAVPESDRLDMYRLYIKKIEQHFGITKTRPIYERAIRELSDDLARNMSQEYADVERKLGEIDRARAILQHGSQFADPRRDHGYWKYWREFEEAHGNEDTFKDMLRVKRSVEASLSQVNHLAADVMSGSFVPAALAGGSDIGDDGAEQKIKTLDELAMRAELEAVAEAGHKRKFVPAAANSVSALDEQRKKILAATSKSETIDIDDFELGDEGGGGFGIQERPVPTAVFGSVTGPAE